MWKWSHPFHIDCHGQRSHMCANSLLYKPWFLGVFNIKGGWDCYKQLLDVSSTQTDWRPGVHLHQRTYLDQTKFCQCDDCPTCSSFGKCWHGCNLINLFRQLCGVSLLFSGEDGLDVNMNILQPRVLSFIVDTTICFNALWKLWRTFSSLQMRKSKLTEHLRTLKIMIHCPSRTIICRCWKHAMQTWKFVAAGLEKVGIFQP